MSGPLGNLPGMSFDPTRNRYFPTPRTATLTEQDTRPVPSAPSSAFSSYPSAARFGAQPGSTAGPSRYDAPQGSSRGPGHGNGHVHDRSSGRDQRMRGHRDPNPNIPQMSKVDSLVSPSPNCLLPTEDEIGTGLKRGRSPDQRGDSSGERVGRLRKGRLGVRYSGQDTGDRHVREQEKILSDLELDSEHHACGCHGEVITSYRSYGEEGYYATTDHGKMVLHLKNGNTAVFTVCAHSLVGAHYDIPRMILMAIAGGPEPHLHLFKRDPEMLDHVFMTQSELNLNRSEIYGISSFDDVCTIGGARSINTISYSARLGSTSRKLQSDALAVHQTSHDLVYIGQRSGEVGLEDLRTPPNPWKQNVVASTMKRKAVVGVQRLDDAAVPWGLVVSGMSHELLLFDVRFGDRPLREFRGHFNTYHTSVSMATSPDDKHVFASGSDRRIRAWNVLTGDPIAPSDYSESNPASFGTKASELPTLWEQVQVGNTGAGPGAEDEANPLRRVFEDRVTHMAVREDLGLDVVERGDLLRFSRRYGV